MKKYPILQPLQYLRRHPRSGCLLLLVLGIPIAALVVYAALMVTGSRRSNSLPPIYRWFTEASSRQQLTTRMNRQPCPGAPFILPSDGLIGLLWDDPAAPYTIFSTHTGIDIFGDGAPGSVPVFAAYQGYLTRFPDWKSSVIIRHDDPLQPGRTIWTYYTHMASLDGSRSFVAADFPPGTNETWVERGTPLGYQGEYAGTGRAPIGLHLHFSIVLSDDDGSFRNEAQLANTLDPSPYFGMPLHIAGLPERPIGCQA